eukprot:NODE_84_length_22349_cov_0.357888.p6 type:complete len:394 gc:universal NODE_84_length_22349_cov_0.357888:1320-2501(+)
MYFGLGLISNLLKMFVQLKSTSLVRTRKIKLDWAKIICKRLHKLISIAVNVLSTRMRLIKRRGPEDNSQTLPILKGSIPTATQIVESPLETTPSTVRLPNPSSVSTPGPENFSETVITPSLPSLSTAALAAPKASLKSTRSTAVFQKGTLKSNSNKSSPVTKNGIPNNGTIVPSNFGDKVSQLDTNKPEESSNSTPITLGAVSALLLVVLFVLFFYNRKLKNKAVNDLFEKEGYKEPEKLSIYGNRHAIDTSSSALNEPQSRGVSNLQNASVHPAGAFYGHYNDQNNSQMTDATSRSSEYLRSRAEYNPKSPEDYRTSNFPSMYFNQPPNVEMERTLALHNADDADEYKVQSMISDITVYTLDSNSANESVGQSTRTTLMMSAFDMKTDQINY